jgi:Ankyrin repeats (3 copies)
LSDVTPKVIVKNNNKMNAKIRTLIYHLLSFEEIAGSASHMGTIYDLIAKLSELPLSDVEQSILWHKSPPFSCRFADSISESIVEVVKATALLVRDLSFTGNPNLPTAECFLHTLMKLQDDVFLERNAKTFPPHMSINTEPFLYGDLLSYSTLNHGDAYFQPNQNERTPTLLFERANKGGWQIEPDLHNQANFEASTISRDSSLFSTDVSSVDNTMIKTDDRSVIDTRPPVIEPRKVIFTKGRHKDGPTKPFPYKKDKLVVVVEKKNPTPASAPHKAETTHAAPAPESPNTMSISQMKKQALFKKLVYRCSIGDYSSVRNFVENVRIDLTQNDNQAIVAACASGKTEIIKLLLGSKMYKVDPSIPNNKPLCAAVSGNHTNVVKLLLQYNIDPNVDDHFCLKTAIKYDSVDMITALFQDPRLKLSSKDVDQLIALSANNKSKEIVSSFVKR